MHRITINTRRAPKERPPINRDNIYSLTCAETTPAALSSAKEARICNFMVWFDWLIDGIYELISLQIFCWFYPIQGALWGTRVHLVYYSSSRACNYFVFHSILFSWTRVDFIIKFSVCIPLQGQSMVVPSKKIGYWYLVGKLNSPWFMNLFDVYVMD